MSCQFVRIGIFQKTKAIGSNAANFWVAAPGSLETAVTHRPDGGNSNYLRNGGKLLPG